MSEIATGKLVIWMRLQAKRITPDGNSTSIMLSAAADRLESQEQTIAALTARAEQDEEREKAAVNNAVRAVFYDTSNGKRGLLVDAGLCDYCHSDRERTKCASCFENGNFELRNDLRGLPQDGEKKSNG